MAYVDNDETGDPKLCVTLDLEADTLENYYSVQIDQYGHCTDLYDSKNRLEDNPNFVTCLNRGIEAIESDLKQRREAKIQKRQKQVKTFRRFVAGALVVGSIGGGAAWAGNKWIIEPRRQAEIARANYDQEDHELPGETLPLESVTASEMPTADFDAIPEFNEGDTLKNPRIVEVKSNSCVAIEATPQEGQELAVAIREGSDLTDSQVTARVNSAGEISLCVTSPGSDLSESGVVAVQLRD